MAVIKHIRRLCRGSMDSFLEWRKRRYWKKRHLSFLRTLISSDARWLSVDEKAKAITERYEKAIGEDWYKHSFEDSSKFRTRLGLDPVYHEKKK